jgi:hypothetical protein
MYIYMDYTISFAETCFNWPKWFHWWYILIEEHLVQCFPTRIMLSLEVYRQMMYSQQLTLSSQTPN